MSSDENRKILFVTTIPRTIREFLLPFAEALRDEGWQVDAMAHGIKAQDDLQAYFDNLIDVPFSRDIEELLKGLPRTWRIIKESIRNDYDIVHMHTPIASFITRMMLVPLGKKRKPFKIYTPHGFRFSKEGKKLENGLTFVAEKIAGVTTDMLITINKEDYETAISRRICRKGKVRSLPGIGLPLGIYDECLIDEAEKEKLLKDLHLTIDNKIVLMIAEFIPRKRHIDLVKALKNIEDESICVVFAGDGPLRKSIEEAVKEYGVANKTRFLGYRKDIPTQIALSYVVVLPSALEGLPRSIMEAMAMRKPVIATDIRGTRELVDENVGILVKVDSPRELANAIDRLARNAELAARLGEGGRQKIIKHYSLEKVLELQMTYYMEALSLQKDS